MKSRKRPRVRTGRTLTGFIAGLVFFAGPALADAWASEHLFEDLRARSIGPAVISGRVMAITGSPADPLTVYAGAATSGIWKTVNGGISWTPIFDETKVSSIGSITVHPADPQLIFAGTGEPKPRYGTGTGNGVYRSRDGGTTWEHLGLAETERIQRVLAHPDDPDLLYVAAVGPARRDGSERGVFRSRDGGESWERILFTNARSGAADLAMDPANPQRLLAAMWEFRRKPWSFVSGGPGSGLYLSEDGGDTWSRLTEYDGLPGGTLGRIGVAFAPADPSRVYAVVESSANGLFRSDDGGRSWVRAGDPDDPRQKFQFGILGRPWYFQQLTVDPVDEDRVYHSADRLFMSRDGGATFEIVDAGKGVHADHHVLWINPRDTRELWAGTDGGVYVSKDLSSAWQFIDKLPWAQLYHVNVDADEPYDVYTSAQDQANWVGPSTAWDEPGIRGHHWQSVAGGESGPVLPVPGDTRFVYGFANMGHLYITDRETGDVRVITPGAEDAATALRRNNAPASALDPFLPDGLYYGSQFLHKTEDRGRTWRVLSPDLTKDDPDKQRYFEVQGLTWENFGGELYSTIVSIAPSPISPDVIWVGTDDGNIQVTGDGGVTWTNTSGGIRNGPATGFWVQQILPSNSDPAAAIVALNDHRRGNRGVHLYRTADFGQTWERIGTDGIEGVAWAVEQDPRAERLLFLGTNAALYVSFDGGSSWLPYPHLPPVQVRGLRVHPRDADLVVATFGRGAYIIDDIRAWRRIARNGALPSNPLTIMSVGPVRQYRRNFTRTSPGNIYAGENEPYGAMITSWAAEGGTATVEIRDQDGLLVSRMESEVHPGLNRLQWDLRYADPARVPSYYYGWSPVTIGDVEVPPGEYRLRMAVGDVQAEASFEVMPDPRLDYSRNDRNDRVRTMLWLRDAAVSLLDGQEQARALGDELRAFATAAGARGRSALAGRAVEIRGQLDSVADRIQFTFEQDKVIVEPYDEVLRREWPGGVLDYVTRIVNRSGESWAAPSPNQVRLFRHAHARIQRVAEELNAVLATEYAELRADAAGSALPPLPEGSPVTIPPLPQDRPGEEAR